MLQNDRERRACLCCVWAVLALVLVSSTIPSSVHVYWVEGSWMALLERGLVWVWMWFEWVGGCERQSWVTGSGPDVVWQSDWELLMAWAETSLSGMAPVMPRGRLS